MRTWRNLELGYHGTSQAAGRSIRQGGFLVEENKLTFGTTNELNAPTSNINTICLCCSNFFWKGGSAQDFLERFMEEQDLINGFGL